MARVAEHVVLDRRRRLEALVGRERYLPVGDLADRLGVSEATARRDLAALEGQNRLARTFGGAVATEETATSVEEYDADFDSYADRAGESADAKKRIAAAVAALVRPGMTLFLDAGTTVGALAEMFGDIPARRLRGVRVVTHSLPVAEKLAGVAAVEVHLPGGRLLGRQMIVLGDATRRALTGFDVHLACLGAEAVNGGGVFNSQKDVADLQRHAAMRAGKTVVMVDAAKLGRDAPARVLLPAEVDLLATDAAPEAVADAGLRLAPKQLLEV